MTDKDASVSLEKYIDEIIRLLQEEINRRWASNDALVTSATAVLNERLERMNQFREQLANERFEYTKRDEFRAAVAKADEHYALPSHAGMERRVQALEIVIDALDSEKIKASGKSETWALIDRALLRIIASAGSITAIIALWDKFIK